MDNIIIQASSYAADIDNLILIITLIVGVWFVLAEGIIFYLLWKSRKKKGEKAKYISGEGHDETKWIHRAHYLVIVCDIVIIIFAVKVWHNVKMTIPEPDSTIEVVGQQWAWKFTHPGLDNKLYTIDDIHTVDELHLENNKVYKFILKADDVVHSFSIPVFRLKQDAVPGRAISGWMKPIVLSPEEGFDIQCAEMCGIGHGVMGAKLFVESPDKHKTWMEQEDEWLSKE